MTETKNQLLNNFLLLPWQKSEKSNDIIGSLGLNPRAEAGNKIYVIAEFEGALSLLAHSAAEKTKGKFKLIAKNVEYLRDNIKFKKN